MIEKIRNYTIDVTLFLGSEFVTCHRLKGTYREERPRVNGINQIVGVSVKDFRMIVSHRIANPLICQDYICVRYTCNALTSLRVNSETPEELGRKRGTLDFQFAKLWLIKILLREKKDEILDRIFSGVRMLHAL